MTNVFEVNWKVRAILSFSCDLTVLGHLGVDPVFYLQVKFYPPEPALLQEDLTR